ncbi:MAG: hypothetical protein V3V13_03405 [Paracoccaceae bacterium]
MPDTLFKNTLVFGGTGMLAMATEFLSERSTKITLGARNPLVFAQKLGATALIANWNNKPETMAALTSLGEFNLMVSWLHKGGMWLAEHLESKLVTGGRSVRIYGSVAKDLAKLATISPDPRPDITRQTVILGWINAPAGRRWLTNTEISDGVIDAVQNAARSRIVVGVFND